MAERPPPPLARPRGYVHVAVPAGPDWVVGTEGTPGGCRFGSGPGRPACGQPASVTLFRTAFRLSGAVKVPWAYCEEHMYGRWVEDGRVMQWVLRPEAEVEAEGGETP